jgi:hypothetical protein
MRRASRITMRNPTSLPTRARKGKNVSVPILRSGFPRKSDLRSIATCARSMGVHIPLTRLMNVVSMRKTEQKNLVSMPLRKVEKNYPVNQNFAQLTKKIDKLEKALKKSIKKVRNTVTRIAIPTPNRELGRVALGKS